MEVKTVPDKLPPPTRPRTPAKIEARPLGTDLALTRVSSDMRVKITEGTTDQEEIRTAQESVYADILREERAKIDALSEADPIIVDAKSKGWSPQVEKDAERRSLIDPDDRHGAKVWREMGIRVEAARQRQAMMAWGKFAEQSPTTAAKFASENKDIGVAIERYRTHKYSEAQRTVQERVRELSSLDERYAPAMQTNNVRVIQLIQSEMTEKAMAEYIGANPDTARFLAESMNDPTLRTAYEKHLAMQEARKAEKAAKAKRASVRGPEEGLRELASDDSEPGLQWERFGIKLSKKKPRKETQARSGNAGQRLEPASGTASPKTTEAPISIASKEGSEEPTLPLKARLAQAGALAARYNYEAQQARQNGRPKSEVQALVKKAQEASVRYDSLLTETVNQEIARNLSRENNPVKRKRTAEDLIRNERDPVKRQKLLDVLITAGILAAETVLHGSSAIKRAA